MSEELSVKVLYAEGFDPEEYKEIGRTMLFYEYGVGELDVAMQTVKRACLRACGSKKYQTAVYDLILHMKEKCYYQSDQDRILSYVLSFDVSGEYGTWLEELIDIKLKKGM